MYTERDPPRQKEHVIDDCTEWKNVLNMLKSNKNDNFSDSLHHYRHDSQRRQQVWDF